MEAGKVVRSFFVVALHIAGLGPPHVALAAFFTLEHAEERCFVEFPEAGDILSVDYQVDFEKPESVAEGGHPRQFALAKLDSGVVDNFAKCSIDIRWKSVKLEERSLDQREVYDKLTLIRSKPASGSSSVGGEGEPDDAGAVSGGAAVGTAPGREPGGAAAGGAEKDSVWSFQGSLTSTAKEEGAYDICLSCRRADQRIRVRGSEYIPSSKWHLRTSLLGATSDRAFEALLHGQDGDAGQGGPARAESFARHHAQLRRAFGSVSTLEERIAHQKKDENLFATQNAASHELINRLSMMQLCCVAMAGIFQILATRGVLERHQLLYIKLPT